MLKVGSCFSGLGAWEKSLTNLGIEYELMFFSEIDKYAIKSYCAIHNELENKNIGDITKINADILPDIDLFVYSPPCQAFSVAGKQLGFEDMRGTLFFDSLKIIEAKRPRYALMENVKGLTGKKFKNEFASMLSSLEKLGYKNHWKVLNSKDFGIPQNRERVFIISIRGDIYNLNNFEWPVCFDNGLRLKDMLEDNVDEKYYLKGKHAEWWEKNKEFQLKKKYSSLDADIAICQTARQFASWTGNHISVVANLESIKGNDQCKRIYNLEPVCCASRGRNPENPTSRIAGLPTEQQIEINWSGRTNTLTSVQKDNYIIDTSYRIRQLTPKECFRLQGFSDSDIDKCIAVKISNSMLYKQAGNSITVNVPIEIFKKLFYSSL